MWRHMADLLAEAAPQSTALIAGDERVPVTYHELGQRVSERAAELTRGGLRPGDVIAVQGRNSVDYVVNLLAATGAGIVVAPLDPALPDQERQRRLDLLGARTTLVDGQTATGALRDRPGPVGLSRDDALVMLTSGTTGTPKMVPWTHDSLSAGVAAVIETYELTAADATVVVMPLFHGHGLVAALLATLTSAGTVLLPGQGRFAAHTFADDMAAARATWYTAVPTIHRIVLQRGDELPPLRFIRSCSAPLSPDLVTELETRFGTQVMAAYGMTETTHQASSVRPGDAQPVRLHTVGSPAGLEARVLCADGKECGPGESGEIVFRGPTVMRGYLGAQPADPFCDGWLRTGDLGVLDLDGNLVVTGRLKNLINRGGEKISPEHVEQVLTAYPGIVGAAVVGVPDDFYGEQVAAAVVTDIPLDIAALTDYCRSRLAPFELPQRIVTVPELPLTAKKDIDRGAVVDSLAAAISGR
jgi:acyl-CoA synthetase (AMP-forming)/AMP-acid ligase II